MRSIYTLLLVSLFCSSSAQDVHQLVMDGTEFQPDTIYMMPGDIIHLTFDTTGHSMVQVPEQSWIDEVAAPLIGISLGEGTPNPGDFHEFAMDSVGTFYYLCEQHPEEKGVIIVGTDPTSIREHGMPGFTVYPQPASEVIFIEHQEKYASARIDDHQGRPVRSTSRFGHQGLDISSLPGGIYFISLLDSEGKPVAREKVIISR